MPRPPPPQTYYPQRPHYAPPQPVYYERPYNPPAQQVYYYTPPPRQRPHPVVIYVDRDDYRSDYRDDYDYGRRPRRYRY